VAWIRRKLTGTVDICKVETWEKHEWHDADLPGKEAHASLGSRPEILMFDSNLEIFCYFPFLGVGKLLPLHEFG
jgi:hypothetical protein